ncbi:MAG: DUF697 domain-containing protein [Rhodospirillaceae bacterium]
MSEDFSNEPTPASESVLSFADGDGVALARAKHAETIITTYTCLSAAAGAIPVPLIDTAALIAVQLKMLKELSDVYEVQFRRDLGKSSIGVLLGSVTPTVLAQGAVGSGLMSVLIARVPVVGVTVRALTMPVFGGAFTYAVGRVFQQHFASGGTFLTFNAKATSEKCGTLFREAKDKVRDKAEALRSIGRKKTTSEPASTENGDLEEGLPA